MLLRDTLIFRGRWGCVVKDWAAVYPSDIQLENSTVIRRLTQQPQSCYVRVWHLEQAVELLPLITPILSKKTMPAFVLKFSPGEKWGGK